MLNLARYPTIQAELGNVNNRDDAAQMEKPEGRQQYAEALVRGITACLGAQPS
jgi:N-acetylmuramoyl-L-alanine amidase